jgi:hypothetical protein
MYSILSYTIEHAIAVLRIINLKRIESSYRHTALGDGYDTFNSHSRELAGRSISRCRDSISALPATQKNKLCLNATPRLHTAHILQQSDKQNPYILVSWLRSLAMTAVPIPYWDCL